MFKPNPAQREARQWLAGPERHKLIYGGARSGKTFILLRAVINRARIAPGSRHLIARWGARFAQSFNVSRER